jgi:magnesium-transporting ATPase (P-type)
LKSLNKERDEFIIKLKNADDVIEEYDILLLVPFTSETKRMSILVKNRITS